MAIWKTIFKELPANEQQVWIRVLTIYGELSIAQYDSVTQTFTVVLTGVVIPVYHVARWKPM